MVRSPFLERQVKRVLYRLGYEADPIAPLDLRDVTDDPMQAAYVSGRRRCVVDVPLADCREDLGFCYSRETLQPYVRTVRAYLEGRVATFEDSPLMEFYDNFQPKNVWEFFDLPGNASSELLQFPPMARILPWEARSLQKKLKYRIVATRHENRCRGADLGIEHGAGAGPVTAEKGALEFQALARLAEDIQKRGYIRSDGHDGDITAVPLIDIRRGVRFLVRGGKHRIAVLTALGFEHVALRTRFVRAPRVEEADHWPHVKDRLFTREQAVFLFKRIFDGSPSVAAIPPKWLSTNLQSIF